MCRCLVSCESGTLDAVRRATWCDARISALLAGENAEELWTPSGCVCVGLAPIPVRMARAWTWMHGNGYARLGAAAFESAGWNVGGCVRCVTIGHVMFV